MMAYGTMPPGVTFRGAPDDVEERARSLTGVPDEPLKDAGQYVAPPIKPRNFFLIFGSLFVCLIVLVPLTDAWRLLENPTFIFFVGRHWAGTLLLMCFFAPLIYMLAILTFFAWSRDPGKTENSLIIVSYIIVAILGLSMMALSRPLRAGTEAVVSDLFVNCQFGVSTQRLYEYATVLHGLRQTPGCATKATVAGCDGYEESMPYTGFLRGMEMQYACSGFCFGNATVAAATAAVAVAPEPETTASPAALFERGSLAGALQRFAAARKFNAGHSVLLQVGAGQVPVTTITDAPVEVGAPAAADAPAVLGTTTLAPGQPGLAMTYPPALFSVIKYTRSCDGMVARDLQYQGVETARWLLWEGSFLLFGVVISGLFKLCSLCQPPAKAGTLSRKAGVIYT